MVWVVVQKLFKFFDIYKNYVSLVDVFIYFEVEGYKRLLEKLYFDLIVVQRVSKGEIVVFQIFQGVILGLNLDQVFKVWLLLIFLLCICLSQWIKEFFICFNIILIYVLERFGVYNVVSFFWFDCFFEVVKYQYVCKYFKEVNFI